MCMLPDVFIEYGGHSAITQCSIRDRESLRNGAIACFVHDTYSVCRTSFSLGQYKWRVYTTTASNIMIGLLIFVWSMLQCGTVDIFMFVSFVETMLVMPVPHSFHVLCSLSWLLFLLHFL